VPAHVIKELVYSLCCQSNKALEKTEVESLAPEVLKNLLVAHNIINVRELSVSVTG